jgi:inner membrane protein
LFGHNSPAFRLRAAARRWSTGAKEDSMWNSAVARLGVMAGLAVVLLVPLMWVQSIVSERASRRASAIGEVSETWGGPQTVGGPVLSVPYTVQWTDSNGRVQRSAGRALSLAKSVRIDGQVATELRRRGIFTVPVYRATLKISGVFARPDLDWIRPAPDVVDWEHASLQVGLYDPHGVTRRATLQWRGREAAFAGGADDVGLFHAGLHAPAPAMAELAAGTEIPFAFTLELNGTRDLRFLPSAAETAVSLASPWPHPSFSGTALPETRSVGRDGFTAQWRVQDFGRSYAAQWTNLDMNRDVLLAAADTSAFGVSLIQPVDIYQQAERAVKYAALFVVLTFLVFFLWEVFSATLLHPMQYAFVGFALCVFYLLLISISEHVGFDRAYLAASAVTTLLIAGYARAVLKGLARGVSVLGALATLYGFLYLLLRLEDYALLAGSVALFVILAFVMFVTRRMNWYDMKLGEHA